MGCNNRRERNLWPPRRINKALAMRATGTHAHARAHADSQLDQCARQTTGEARCVPIASASPHPRPSRASPDVKRTVLPVRRCRRTPASHRLLHSISANGLLQSSSPHSLNRASSQPLASSPRASTPPAISPPGSPSSSALPARSVPVCACARAQQPPRAVSVAWHRVSTHKRVKFLRLQT